MSRTSSTSNLHAAVNVHADRDVFTWSQLHGIGHQIYEGPQKSSTELGSPTVLAANGLICVGKDNGRIFVFDFKQTFKCVCGSNASGAPMGGCDLCRLISLQVAQWAL